MLVNSVQCTLCIKWIHKRCSCVRGDLSLVVDGFRCKRCDGTIQEVDLAENLVVDGETYGCVKSVSYLEDTLDGDGGVDLVATALSRYIYKVLQNNQTETETSQSFKRKILT